MNLGRRCPSLPVLARDEEKNLKASTSTVPRLCPPSSSLRVVALFRPQGGGGYSTPFLARECALNGRGEFDYPPFLSRICKPPLALQR